MVGPTRENFDATVVSITWSSDQTLWYPVLARSSSQQHGAKENVCTPRMETNVAPLCSQDVKIQQKGVSRHYLTPEYSGEDNTPSYFCRILLFRQYIQKYRPWHYIRERYV